MKDLPPRHVLWVSDMPSNQPPNELTDADFDAIQKARYTHVIAAFFHIDPRPRNEPLSLVYNGPTPAHTLGDLWQKYRSLQPGKGILMSLGGWGSGTWERQGVLGREDEAADLIAAFVEEFGFDGVDLNFEGSPPVRSNPSLLNSLGKLVCALWRRFCGANGSRKLITITPMYDNFVKQLNAVQQAMEPAGSGWADALSWINLQLYVYQGPIAAPLVSPASFYRSSLSQTIGGEKILPGKLVAGFPLERPEKDENGNELVSLDAAIAFNRSELKAATNAVAELSKEPDFGGVFVYRYKFTKYPSDLNWPEEIAKILYSRPPAPTDLRIIEG